MSSEGLWSNSVLPQVDVAIIGGGFSGILSAITLLRREPSLTVAVFERSKRAAPGVAYGNCGPNHLLNVPAKNMGAFSDDPRDFLRWLSREYPNTYSDNDFVPRALYGKYLQSLLEAARTTFPNSLFLVQQAVVALAGAEKEITLTLADGSLVLASAVILAVGQPQAGGPWSKKNRGVPARQCIVDPWQPQALNSIPSDADVAIFGTGLTAIDVVTSLIESGHKGKISLLSRRGRLPLPHADLRIPAQTICLDTIGDLSLRKLVRKVREDVRNAVAAGMPWQTVIDGLRPHTAALWQGFSIPERRLFLRHLKPLWEIHRHRAPAHLIAELKRLKTSGQLEIHAARLRVIEPTSQHRIAVQLYSSGQAVTIIADCIINCTGPSDSLEASTDPLLGQMLREGELSVDAFGLGVATNLHGHLLRKNGALEERIVLLGSLRKGQLWEITSVPDLRVHAAAAAAAIGSTLRGESVASVSQHSSEQPSIVSKTFRKRAPRQDARGNPPEALRGMFDELSELSGCMSAEEMLALIERHSVAVEALGESIHIHSSSYVRTLVFENEFAEVLVMAWLPGQRSPIHDHAGSVCGVRVLSGSALERRYRLRDDGLVAAVGQQQIHPGQVICSIDNDIHSLGNFAELPSSPRDLLVTLHLYSPPLAPTRKYTEYSTLASDSQRLGQGEVAF